MIKCPNWIEANTKIVVNDSNRAKMDVASFYNGLDILKLMETINIIDREINKNNRKMESKEEVIVNLHKKIEMIKFP